jgi:hypothetical protein
MHPPIRPLGAADKKGLARRRIDGSTHETVVERRGQQSQIHTSPLWIPIDRRRKRKHFTGYRLAVILTRHDLIFLLTDAFSGTAIFI